MVYPAAMFAPQVAARGVPVAEFNMETTPATNRFRYGEGRPKLGDGGGWGVGVEHRLGDVIPIDCQF